MAKTAEVEDCAGILQLELFMQPPSTAQEVNRILDPTDQDWSLTLGCGFCRVRRLPFNCRLHVSAMNCNFSFAGRVSRTAGSDRIMKIVQDILVRTFHELASYCSSLRAFTKHIQAEKRRHGGSDFDLGWLVVELEPGVSKRKLKACFAWPCR